MENIKNENPDFLNGIIEFNKDERIIDLKRLYSQPSFFEIISKERSEVTYSSFLKWLLQLNGNNAVEVSPLMLFMDIIIKKSQEQKVEKDSLDVNLMADLLSRKVRLSRTEISTEKSVSEVAYNVLHKENNNTTTPESLLKQAINSKDRIDIFIEAAAVGENSTHKVQIIIENKIDALEGKPNKKKESYNDFSQTERYFLASNVNNIPQFYVFLTRDKKTPEDKHFINITYQDLLDGIILPLLNSQSLNSRDKLLLTEFKNELMFPNIGNFKRNGCIAISKEISKEISEIWKSHESLIVNSILATINEKNPTTFWRLNDSYFNTFPKKELIERLKKLNNPDINSQELENNSKLSLIKLAQENGIGIQEIKSEIPETEFILFKKFYEENNDFILALLSSISKAESKKVDCFFDYLRRINRQGRKKYSVYFRKELKGKPNMGNWNTVFEITKCWAEDNRALFKGLSPDEIVNKLNKEISVKLNSYYANQKILKQLFYEYKEEGEYLYDGSALNGQAITRWDMYKPGAGSDYYFSIFGTKITMAKMWRTPDVENFIKYMIERMGTISLSVEQSV